MVVSSVMEWLKTKLVSRSCESSNIEDPSGLEWLKTNWSLEVVSSYSSVLSSDGSINDEVIEKKLVGESSELYDPYCRSITLGGDCGVIDGVIKDKLVTSKIRYVMVVLASDRIIED